MSKLKNVSAISTYEIDKSFDSEKFIKLRVRVAHDGVNFNGSNFNLSDMNKAKDSIVNIPILAYCYFDEDNNPQFDIHAMHIEKDKVKEGEYRLIYDELPIGLVPETCNYEVKEFNGKNYVYVDAFIWRGYSNYATDTIERDKDINVSMEIAVDSYKFNKELNCYDITDYRYTGITLLGNDIGTGMLDAKATTSTFDLDAKKEKTVILMQELKDELALFNIKNLGKEDEILTDKIEETVVETTEEFTEVVEPIVEAVNEEVIETPETEEVVEETEVIEVTEEFTEVVVEEVIEVKFSSTYQQKREALQNALQGIEKRDENGLLIEELRYWVADFDDSYVYVEKNMWINGDYNCEKGRFGYTFDSSELIATLSGEFEIMIVTWLTVEENDKLQKSRDTFELNQTEFVRLQAFEQKTISDKYEADVLEVFTKFEKDLKSVIDFESLKTKYDGLTVEAIEEKCFALLGKKNANFSAKTKETVVKIAIEHQTEDEPEDPYGGILSKKYNK